MSSAVLVSRAVLCVLCFSQKERDWVWLAGCRILMPGRFKGSCRVRPPKSSKCSSGCKPPAALSHESPKQSSVTSAPSTNWILRISKLFVNNRTTQLVFINIYYLFILFLTYCLLLINMRKSMYRSTSHFSFFFFKMTPY